MVGKSAVSGSFMDTWILVQRKVRRREEFLVENSMQCPLVEILTFALAP